MNNISHLYLPLSIYIPSTYEEILGNVYTFDKFLEDVKRGGNRTFNTLFEIYHLPKELTWDELANLYDDYEFHLMYGHPVQYNYEKTLNEFLNTTILPDKFKQAIQLIPSCFDYDEFEQAGRIGVYFATDEAVSLDENNLLLHPDDEKEIEQLCLSYGYCINQRTLVKYKDELLITIDFMPNYTLEVTNRVYAFVHPRFHPENAVLYHVCPKDIWENKIKKTGLIPKCKAKHKRYYEPRVYFFYTYDKNKFIKNIKDLKQGITANEKSNIDLTKWVILKIDLKHAREKYRFFKDPEYISDYEACFTYETIHPRCISLIDEIQI